MDAGAFLKIWEILINAQFAMREPLRHPSGATSPFRRGKFKGCTFGAIVTQSRDSELKNKNPTRQVRLNLSDYKKIKSSDFLVRRLFVYI